MSESEAEDDPQNHVTLSQKISSRGNVVAGSSAIRLSELGPRLTLQLIKIEDGLLSGEVLYHDIISKTDEEKAEIAKRRAQKKYAFQIYSFKEISVNIFFLANTLSKCKYNNTKDNNKT